MTDFGSNLSEFPASLGILCLGIFVGFLLGFALAKSGGGLKAAITVIGAALGSGPLLFMEGADNARWAYPVGLVLGLLVVTLGTQRKVLSGGRASKIRRFFAWADLIVIFGAILIATAWAAIPREAGVKKRNPDRIDPRPSPSPDVETKSGEFFVSAKNSQGMLFQNTNDTTTKFTFVASGRWCMHLNAGSPDGGWCGPTGRGRLAPEGQSYRAPGEMTGSLIVVRTVGTAERPEYFGPTRTLTLDPGETLRFMINDGNFGDNDGSLKVAWSQE